MNCGACSRYVIKFNRIYFVRTEISNFGGLPQGITLADLRIEHHSILRNPDIAQMCFIRNYIEMLGSGTLRMIKDCKENKFKTPVWKVKENIITVTFPDVTHNRKIEGTTKGITEGISKSIVAKVEGITEGITEDVKEKINKILLVLYKEGGVRTVDIKKRIDVPVKSVERYIKLLREAGIIEFSNNSQHRRVRKSCSGTPALRNLSLFKPSRKDWVGYFLVGGRY